MECIVSNDGLQDVFPLWLFPSFHLRVVLSCNPWEQRGITDKAWVRVTVTPQIRFVTLQIGPVTSQIGLVTLQ